MYVKASRTYEAVVSVGGTVEAVHLGGGALVPRVDGHYLVM